MVAQKIKTPCLHNAPSTLNQSHLFDAGSPVRRWRPVAVSIGPTSGVDPLLGLENVCIPSRPFSFVTFWHFGSIQCCATSGQCGSAWLIVLRAIYAGYWLHRASMIGDALKLGTIVDHWTQKQFRDHAIKQHQELVPFYRAIASSADEEKTNGVYTASLNARFS